MVVYAYVMRVMKYVNWCLKGRDITYRFFGSERVGEAPAWLVALGHGRGFDFNRCDVM